MGFSWNESISRGRIIKAAHLNEILTNLYAVQYVTSDCSTNDTATRSHDNGYLGDNGSYNSGTNSYNSGHID